MRRLLTITVLLVCLAPIAGAEFRFPMPEFDSGYTYPEFHVPDAKSGFEAWDVLVLLAALVAATWLVLKRRSRNEIFLLTVACLIYFGFIREGCICSVGSVQNVAAALFDSTVGVPVTVILFFLLPLIFALFFGRVFCAAVCPLGAIQEAVAIRPVEVPKPAERVLALFPPIYLGLTLLSVATGAGYLICRYDPFVGFFRMGAGFNMLVTGGILLVTGIFIFRPYCRFLCPYGVLLNWMSRLSKWHAAITPAECIQCRLCEDSCPYNAINQPLEESPQQDRSQGTRRLGLVFLITPLLIVAAGGAGWAISDVLARLHPTVRLAERVAAEDLGRVQDTILESETFRAGRETEEALFAEASALRVDYKTGGALFGAFVGLIVACKLIALSVVRRRIDFEPDRGHCLSCGRCYAYCPVEKTNQGLRHD